jgi:spore coat protein A
MTTRRRFIQAGTIAGAGLLLPWRPSMRDAFAQTVPLLDPLTQPKFVNALPAPQRVDATRGRPLQGEIKEFDQSLGLVDAKGKKLNTTVWGYELSGAKRSFPGATLVARRNTPVTIRWENKIKEFDLKKLPPTQAHLLPLDTSIHLAMPQRLPKVGVPTVTHLHGGHSESASDGLPEAWFTKDFKETGPDFVKRDYRYDNDQEAATLWYHDHALGLTRLNVYAGLAGFYLLRDANEERLIADGVLPGGAYEREVVIQDRMFTAAGQLFYPADPPPGTTATFPSVLPEFFGNFIVVNGMTWPVLDVEPRKYRLRMLNGSDSRFYVLEFRIAQPDGNALPFLQIGTDGGFLSTPVELTQLVLAPGERADLIVDFTSLRGAELFLRNFGPDGPFMGLGMAPPANPATTGQVFKMRVSQPLSGVPNAKIGAGVQLRDTQLPSFGTANVTRQLVLFEGQDQFGRLRTQLGTLTDGSLLWDEPITERPRLNDVELWEVYNATADAHPIHLHLVTFQILNRQGFTGDVVADGADPIEGGTKLRLQNVELPGAPVPPAPNEAGLKDTAQMFPGQVTRIIAKFDRPGEYVWHCHILSHEDHEMMRPYFVG